MIFSLKDLKRFYKEINKLGQTLTFNEFNGQKCFLIRHDIDFDLEKAYKIAKIENAIGIKATYFILITTDLYNVLSHKNRNLLNKIKNLNHEIGLHFNASLYNSDYQKHAKKEAQILSSIIDKKVNSISVHDPTIHGIYPKFSSFNDAYSTKFFNSKFYLSDAKFDFRGKNPFEIINKIQENHIQISLHPIHYSKDGNKNYLKIFNKLFKKRLLDFDQIALKNIKYKENSLKNGYSIHIDSNEK